MATKKAAKSGKSKKKRKRLVVAKNKTRVKKDSRAKRITTDVAEVTRKIKEKLGAEAVRPAAEVVQLSGSVIPEILERAAEACPYCNSKDFVKRGLRENKHQAVQLYVCRNTECARTFTSRTIKGKQFPWPVVLDAVSYHNLGYTFEQAAQILEAKRGVKPMPDTMAKWYEEYKPLCRFERMRPYALKILAAWRSRSKEKFDMVETTTLAHRQLYRFRYHRPKLVLALEEFKNRRFGRLMEFLDAVSTETPHQFFSDGEHPKSTSNGFAERARMSEVRSKFDKTDMIVKSKENFANQLTKFVLQGVPENKERHEALQRFMIANDSVTVATEVPVYIRREDVGHMENVLKFKILDDAAADGAGMVMLKGHKRPVSFPKILTGHIDFVQVRNGIVHLLDYKPGAAKEKPIEQLTWYALALSRLTGLRLFEFKCAWFDEHEYFEFYPLHVVKKLGRARTKKIRYKDGSIGAIPRENALAIV